MLLLIKVNFVLTKKLILTMKSFTVLVTNPPQPCLLMTKRRSVSQICVMEFNRYISISESYVSCTKHPACLSVRGTTSIQDVVTDIRAVPVPFPQEEEEEATEYTTDHAFCDNDEWTEVFRGKGLASCGMAGAALNLFKENADSLAHLARNGYRIRIVGHSLGGGVATLLGILISHHLEKLKIVEVCNASTASGDDRLLRVYGYGTPSCVDSRLADYTRAYATNVVLHDGTIIQRCFALANT